MSDEIAGNVWILQRTIGEQVILSARQREGQHEMLVSCLSVLEGSMGKTESQFGTVFKQFSFLPR